MPEYITSATPDAVIAAIAHLERGWGHGYRILGLDSPQWGSARIHVAHSDGSRFTITADRWGNIVPETERERRARVGG